MGNKNRNKWRDLERQKKEGLRTRTGEASSKPTTRHLLARNGSSPVQKSQEINNVPAANNPTHSNNLIATFLFTIIAAPGTGLAACVRNEHPNWAILIFVLSCGLGAEAAFRKEKFGENATLFRLRPDYVLRIAQAVFVVIGIVLLWLQSSTGFLLPAEHRARLAKWEKEGHGLLIPGDDLRPIPYHFDPIDKSELAVVYGNDSLATFRGGTFTAIKHSGVGGIVISSDGHEISLSGSFYDYNGQKVGKIVDNEIFRDPAYDGDIELDFTSEQNTVTVYDTSGLFSWFYKPELLKLRFTDPRTITLTADFYTKDGRHIVIGQDGIEIDKASIRRFRKYDCQMGFEVEGSKLLF